MFIGMNAVIGAGTVIEKDAVICADSTVIAGLTLGKNAFVDTGTTQSADIPGSKVPAGVCVAIP